MAEISSQDYGSVGTLTPPVGPGTTPLGPTVPGSLPGTQDPLDGLRKQRDAAYDAYRQATQDEQEWLSTVSSGGGVWDMAQATKYEQALADAKRQFERLDAAVVQGEKTMATRKPGTALTLDEQLQKVDAQQEAESKRQIANTNIVQGQENARQDRQLGATAAANQADIASRQGINQADITSREGINKADITSREGIAALERQLQQSGLDQRTVQAIVQEQMAAARETNAQKAQTYLAELQAGIRRGEMDATAATAKFQQALEYWKAIPRGPTELNLPWIGLKLQAAPDTRPSPFQLAGFANGQFPTPNMQLPQRPDFTTPNASDAFTRAQAIVGSRTAAPPAAPAGVGGPGIAPPATVPPPVPVAPGVPTVNSAVPAQVQAPSAFNVGSTVQPSGTGGPPGQGGPTAQDYAQWKQQRSANGQDPEDVNAWRQHAEQVFGSAMIRPGG